MYLSLFGTFFLATFGVNLATSDNPGGNPDWWSRVNHAVMSVVNPSLTTLTAKSLTSQQGR